MPEALNRVQFHYTYFLAQKPCIFLATPVFEVCRIVIDLRYIGVTPGQIISLLWSFDPELSLQLVRPSFANVHLMKAIFAKA